MSGAQEIIRPLIAQDIPQVVEIFCEQFPNLNWTRLGRKFYPQIYPLAFYDSS